MNTNFNAKNVRQAFVTAIAISLISLPLLTSAAGNNSGFFGDKKNQVKTTDHETIYTELQVASRQICGSSSLQLTGSVERVVANNECYEGTLTAAVERLNNSKVQELHKQKS